MEETQTTKKNTGQDMFEQCLNTPDYWFLHWKHSKQLHMTLLTFALGTTCLIPDSLISDNWRECLATVGFGLLFTRLFTATTADHIRDFYYEKLKLDIKEQYAKRQSEICACREKIMNENIIMLQQQ